MNEKNNKKRTSVLNSKNLIVVGITAVAVVLFAIIMTYIMPKSTESDKKFDNKAWREAVSQAEQSNTADPSDSPDAYNQASKSANTDALPTQSNTSEKNETSDTANSAEKGGEPKNAENNGTTSNNDSENETKNNSHARTSMRPPTDGAVLNDYSGDNLVFSKTMQDWRTHNGIDFSANEGDEVHAAADGTVEAVTDNGMFGKTIILIHSGGVRTVYSNLSEEDSVAVGDSVLSGSVIGKVGNTAAAEVNENPHLHFEVSVNEETVNPHDFISQPQSTESDIQE